MSSWEQLRAGMVLGLIISIGGGVLWLYFSEPEKVDAAADAIVKYIVHPQPQGISQVDWYFGCRKPSQCPNR